MSLIGDNHTGQTGGGELARWGHKKNKRESRGLGNFKKRGTKHNVTATILI